MSKLRDHWPVWAAAAMVLLFLCPKNVAAQGTASSSAQSASSEPSSERADRPRRGGTSTSAELARETREAAGEEDDTTNQFRHSGPVQFFARLTGISAEWSYRLCVLFNFLIIAAVILWFSRKSVPALFRNRTAAIQQAMTEARKASEDANRRLAEIETRLSRLDGEISAMRATAEQEAGAEEERIKAAAAEDAGKIVTSAQQEIAAAAKIARRELTAYAADLAISLASRQIRVDASTDQALVSSFAKQLAGNGSNKGES